MGLFSPLSFQNEQHIYKFHALFMPFSP